MALRGGSNFPMKKKVNCTRKRDFKVDIDKHNTARGMEAKALWGITHPNTSLI